jgi:hypothetical protein
MRVNSERCAGHYLEDGKPALGHPVASRLLKRRTGFGPSDGLIFLVFFDDNFCGLPAVAAAENDTCAVTHRESGRASTCRPARGFHGRRHMTYMGEPYYPEWLDNLADDVTLEAAAMDGTAHGAEDVRAILVVARDQYEHQEFNYAGPCGESSYVEDYTSSVLGMSTRVVVLVSFNAAGQTQYVVVNHRPRSAMLQFSRLMLEKFVDSPYAKHWQGTP